MTLATRLPENSNSTSSINLACHDLTYLFFGPEDDGRREAGREAREALCRAICFACEQRVRCLERAMVHKEPLGVWGGMGEGERREFRTHMNQEGYVREVPEGLEFQASLNTYYQQHTPVIAHPV